MNDAHIRIEQTENGFVMTFSYNDDNADYHSEKYIATTKAKLQKMVKNTINLITKETNNAD